LLPLQAIAEALFRLLFLRRGFPSRDEFGENDEKRVTVKESADTHKMRIVAIKGRIAAKTIQSEVRSFFPG
jgi:hypothetical protein